MQRAIPSWLPLPADAKQAALTDMRAGYNNTAMYNPTTELQRFVFAPLTCAAGAAAPKKDKGGKGALPPCFLAIHSAVPLRSIGVWWLEAPTDRVGFGSERAVRGGLYAAGAGMYDVARIEEAKAALAEARGAGAGAAGEVAKAEAALADVLWRWRRCQMGVEIALQVRTCCCCCCGCCLRSACFVCHCCLLSCLLARSPPLPYSNAVRVPLSQMGCGKDGKLDKMKADLVNKYARGALAFASTLVTDPAPSLLPAFAAEGSVLSGSDSVNARVRGTEVIEKVLAGAQAKYWLEWFKSQVVTIGDHSKRLVT